MKQSAFDFYDYYHLRGDSVHIDGTRSLKIPSGSTLQKPVSSSAMLRHNSQENWTEVGLDDTWMVLVDRPNIGTFVNRSGDSMFGHLNMWQTAKIYNTDGNPVEPSYSFVNDTDTGLFRNTEDSMSVIVGGRIEQTPIVRFERYGSEQREKNTYFEGDVWIDEITFTRRGELKLDGDYAYFTGSNGLRLPQGTTAQRLPDNRPVPVALTRYNSLTNNFEFGYADTFTEFDGINSNWGILSHKKDTSTWLVRKGDSMYGDIQMVQNARILLERGTASQPSLTFDVDKNTGLYKTPNGFSIAVESDILDTPAVSFERKDNNSHDGFNTYFQGDVWIDEITFTRKDSLKLDGDYAYFTGNRGLTLPRGNNANRFAEVGITRYNNEQNVFEMYHTDEWLQFSGRRDTDTYVNRKGDSIYGDLRFTNNARSRNTFGTAGRPSITFNGREDIGFYTTGNSNISFSLDASVNNYPLFSADRYGTGNKERNFYLNSKLFVDEIVSAEFLFTSNKVTIAGTTGLRTAMGTTAQRIDESGIIRFNTDNDGFDLRTSDEWLVLSGNKDIDTYVNRKGDSIYGDLRFTDNARSRHSYGTVNSPSITFLGDEDTGLYHDGKDSIGVVLGSSLNNTPVLHMTRNNNTNTGNTVTINGDLIVTGTASQINTTDTNILDNIITLNKNGTNVLSGIEIEIDGTIRGRFQYSYSTTEWSVDNNFIADVKYAVDPDHAVNKQLLDDVEDELRTEYTFLINEERDRAIAEETRIEGKLDNEIDRSITRDDNIELALNNEITRATKRENEIESNLNSEITRATNRENEIKSNLNSEITRATNRENEIESNLNSEITRATNRENEIESNLNSGLSDLINNYGINKYVFTTTINSETEYTILNTNTGDYDLLDSIVDVKIVDPVLTSNTYNKYVNGSAAVTVSYESDRIEVYNETTYDLIIRIVVWAR